MPWLSKVKAVLVQFLPGESSGTALAATIFGDADPAGRLPLSFPLTEDQTWITSESQYPGVPGPWAGGAKGNTATYSEELLIGYRWYDAKKQAPLFEFGHGLVRTLPCCPAARVLISSLGASAASQSYATYEWSDLKAGSGAVSCTVKNTGKRAGVVVSQMYLEFPSSAGEPPRQLRGFAKQPLAAGATAQVNFELSARDRSVWDATSGGWKEVAGTFGVVVGSSSRAAKLHGSFTVKTDDHTAKTDDGAADVTLDFSQTGRVFEGLGALSGGGGTSRLLYDYQEPQRKEILDALFDPKAGGALHIFKTEIGGDAQSTEGKCSRSLCVFFREASKKRLHSDGTQPHAHAKRFELHKGV